MTFLFYSRTRNVLVLFFQIRIDTGVLVQCAGLEALVRELRTRRDRWVSQLEAPLPSLVAGDWETIYVEVKDQVTYFKGWHVQTSLAGPLNKLCGLVPFRDELSPCLFSSASNMHVTIPPASPRAAPPPPPPTHTATAASPANSSASEFYVQVSSPPHRQILLAFCT